LSHHYCYLLLSWKSWNMIAAGSSNGVTNTRCCRYSCLHSWRWVVVPPEICRAVSRSNKLCNFASCWTYSRIAFRFFKYQKFILHYSLLGRLSHHDGMRKKKSS
jgi:hypothetical protein